MLTDFALNEIKQNVFVNWVILAMKVYIIEVLEEEKSLYYIMIRFA